MFKNLIPKIFYSQLEDGLAFFVDVLGFELAWRDDSLAVVERDGAKAYLMQSPELAALDRPELAIETDDIEAVHAEMAARAGAPASQSAERAVAALGCAGVRDARQDHRLRGVSAVAGRRLRACETLR